MKKSILILSILIGFLLFPCSSFAKMETKSLTIGGNNEEESSIQTILKHEVESPVQEQPAAPVEVNNYIEVPPAYNYYPYPYTNYYTRTVGPYGVYTNVGGFSFNYQGHGFSYGGGFNQPIYVGPPIPPPHARPPHSGGRPPHGQGRPPHK